VAYDETDAMTDEEIDAAISEEGRRREAWYASLPDEDRAVVDRIRKECVDAVVAKMTPLVEPLIEATTRRWFERYLAERRE
jgi:hypothetical protein